MHVRRRILVTEHHDRDENHTAYFLIEMQMVSELPDFSRVHVIFIY